MRDLKFNRPEKPPLTVYGVPDEKYVFDSVLAEIAAVVPHEITELQFLELTQYEAALHPSRGMYLRNYHPEDRKNPWPYRTVKP